LHQTRSGSEYFLVCSQQLPSRTVYRNVLRSATHIITPPQNSLSPRPVRVRAFLSRFGAFGVRFRRLRAAIPARSLLRYNVRSVVLLPAFSRELRYFRESLIGGDRFGFGQTQCMEKNLDFSGADNYTSAT